MRIFTLLLATAALSAQPSTRLQTGYDSIQPAHLKADLTFLSSDAVEGRLSLQQGSEVAIQWIASEFAKAGLKPAAGDSFLQPVPLIEYKMDRDGTFLKTRIGGSGQVFRAPDASCNDPDDGVYKGRV